ncbi:MAG: hypothetical protein U0136_14515 [Bdellovibrionota bacterium]
MNNDALPPEEKPTLLSEAPGYVKFFFDPNRPLALRVAIGVLIAGIFFYPLIAATKGSKPRQQPAPSRSEADQQNTDEETKAPSGATAATEKSGNDSRKPASDMAEPAEDRAPEPERAVAERATTTASSDGEAAPEPEEVESGLNTPFAPVQNVFRIATALSQLKNGNVWVTTTQELAELKDGDPSQLVKKLDRSSFDHMFDRDLSPITAAYADGANDLWTGSRDGEIMRYSNYDWKIIFERREPLKEQITALAEYRGDLYIGSKGLMKWNIASGKLSRLKGFNGVLVHCLTVTPTFGLLVGAANGVWRLTDEGWQELYTMNAEQGGALALLEDQQQNILVGSANGLIRISKAGVVAGHLLTGSSIASITSGPKGELWVGTADSGLRYFDGQDWYQADKAQGLPAGSIAQLLRDAHDQVWIGVPGKGLFVAKAPEAVRWIKANKHVDVTPDHNAPRIYKNACAAAQKELGKSDLSGEVSHVTVDGQELVFFQGRLVCPRGYAYRRDDGKIAVLQAWTISIYSNGNRQEVTVPREIPADQATAIFLDSRDRIWLGTTAGPAYYDNGQWVDFAKDPMLMNNGVQAIVEDANANIWLGTNPTFNKEANEYEQPNLHQLSAQGWSHYGPANGLISWLINSLLPLKDGRLAIGTRAGVCFLQGDKFSLGNLTKAKQAAVSDLSQDERGTIWTGHLYFYPGLTWFDSAGLHHFAPRESLVDQNIVSVTPDGQGQLWVLGAKGKLGVYPRSYFENPESADAGIETKPGASADERTERVEKAERIERAERTERPSRASSEAATNEQKSLFGE